MTHVAVALTGAMFVGIGLYRGKGGEQRPWARRMYVAGGSCMVVVEAIIAAFHRS